MVSRRRGSKSYKKIKARKMIRTRRRRGSGLMPWSKSNSSCNPSLSSNQIQSMKSSDVNGMRLQKMYQDCGCAPGSQKPTCINIDYYNRSMINPNANNYSSNY
jgi:hypothetical protein